MQFPDDDDSGVPSRPGEPPPSPAAPPPGPAPPRRARIVIQRGPFSSLATWIILAFAFLTAIVLDAFFSDSGMMQVWNLEREHKQLQRERDALRADNGELAERIERLESDPAAVEAAAREELNFARPDEDVYLFPENTEPATETTAEDATEGK